MKSCVVVTVCQLRAVPFLISRQRQAQAFTIVVSVPIHALFEAGIRCANRHPTPSGSTQAEEHRTNRTKDATATNAAKRGTPEKQAGGAPAKAEEEKSTGGASATHKSKARARTHRHTHTHQGVSIDHQCQLQRHHLKNKIMFDPHALLYLAKCSTGAIGRRWGMTSRHPFSAETKQKATSETRNK